MINYSFIDRSIQYYTNEGFARIESPWTVTPAISNITKPKDVPQSFQLNHNGKVLVASGEQSFLYLYVKGFLPKGQFQTVTPCFRYEPHDTFHTKTFIKNELIKTDVVTIAALHSVINKARLFFSSLGLECAIVSTDIGYDLMYRDVEIGSYGIRECPFLKWIYGTGLAEPRFSATMQTYGLPQN